MHSMVMVLPLVNVEVLRGQFFSLTDSYSVGYWYKGTIFLMNYFILSCAVL